MIGMSPVQLKQKDELQRNDTDCRVTSTTNSLNDTAVFLTYQSLHLSHVISNSPSKVHQIIFALLN